MSATISPRLSTAYRVADWMLAGAFLAITSVEVWVFTGDDGYGFGLRVAATVLTMIASAALAFRRRFPTRVFWVNAAAVIATIGVGYPSDFYQWTNLVAIYSVAAHGEGWQRWAALPVGVGGVASYFARFPAAGGAALASFVASVWVLGWLAGRMYGARLDEIRLRHERDLSRRLAEANQERLAVEEERNRIARELHDIIGHSVNVMVVHAGAGKREIERDAGSAAAIFDTIADTGRAALSELDRVLAVLRRDDIGVDDRPPPGITQLDELAASLTGTGLEVGLHVSGEPDRVPTSVSLAGYRIVQEAFTNTLRHAHAGRVDAEVQIGDGKLRIRVADDGGGVPGQIRPGGGILGMRERAALHGGSLRLERNASRGVAVVAELTWAT